jgi:hypothetical protein
MKNISAEGPAVKASRNTRTLVINIICLAGIAFFNSPWLPDFFKMLFLPEENWYPSLWCAYAPMPLFVFFVIYPFFVFFSKLFQLLYKLVRGKIGEYGGWNYIHLIMTFLVLFLTFGTESAITRARQVFDKRVDASFARLKPGMTEKEVGKLVLETNMALIGKNTEQKDYNPINEALNNLKAAKNFDLNKFFSENYFDFGLFLLESNEKSEQTFRRRYSNDMDFQISYILDIVYNPEKKLQSARYDKSVYMETDASCQVLAEIPAAKGKQYPHPCPEKK